MHKADSSILQTLYWRYWKGWKSFPTSVTTYQFTREAKYIPFHWKRKISFISFILLNHNHLLARSLFSWQTREDYDIIIFNLNHHSSFVLNFALLSSPPTHSTFSEERAILIWRLKSHWVPWREQGSRLELSRSFDCFNLNSAASMPA